MPMHALLLLAFLQAQPAGEPLRSGCSTDADQIATIAPGDDVHVAMGIAGEAQPCYTVTITRSGQKLTGYVLGDALPAIQEFQRQREKASRAAAEAAARYARAQAAAARKPAAKADAKPEKPKDPLISTRFEDFSGHDQKGKGVSLANLNGRAVIVNFWSPKGHEGPHQITALLSLYNHFHREGLSAVGISMDPNPDRIGDALDDVTPTWSQIPDREGLAARYHIDPKVGKVFVLDSDHRIVAAGPMGPEIEKAVHELMGQGSGRP